MITLSAMTLYAVGVVLGVVCTAVGVWVGSRVKQWQVDEWELLATQRKEQNETLYLRLEQTEAVARAFRSSLPENNETDG